MNSTPGSAQSYAALMIFSQSARAGIRLTIRQGTSPSLPVQRLGTSSVPSSGRPASGNTSGQSASLWTAAMNASLTSTERLKCLSAAGSRFASTNNSMSG